MHNGQPNIQFLMPLKLRSAPLVATHEAGSDDTEDFDSMWIDKITPAAQQVLETAEMGALSSHGLDSGKPLTRPRSCRFADQCSKS